MATEKHGMQCDLIPLQPKVDDLENRLQTLLEDRSRLQLELDNTKKALKEHQREPGPGDVNSLEPGVDKKMEDDIEAAKNERDQLTKDVSP